MPLYPLETKHKYFFDWFEDKRKKDGLYYSVRKQGGDRLSHGYIFLGNDDYVGVPLVAHRDWRSKIASIQFVYGARESLCSMDFASRNLAGLNLNDEDIDKSEVEFHQMMQDFDKEIYKYVNSNGGRVLTRDEWNRLGPKGVKEPVFILEVPAWNKTSNNEYGCKLFFNETNLEKALDKFYAFWKEYGIPYWSDYFSDPTNTVKTINSSLKKINPTLAKCNWPQKV